VLRGMLTYVVLWPSSNLCQQAIQRRESFNYAETFRFSLFGTFFVAPSIYLWVRTIGVLIPGQSLQVALKKVYSHYILLQPEIII